MSFANLPLLTSSIKYGKSEFTVRGLSTEDVARIIPRFGAEVSVLFGGLLSGKDINPSTLPTLLQTVVTEAPELVAAIISFAADEPNDKGMEVARRLPLPVQVDALTAIYENTFTTEGDLEKFVGVIARIVGAAAGMVDTMTPAVLSGIGIGTSVAA